MRRAANILALCMLGSCSQGEYFIPGSGQLPSCDEAPVIDLDGTTWFDRGTVTILSEGCEGATTGSVFDSCALNWVFTQEGNDVTIVVDTEYRIDGRLCGDQLYLRGGWWLPVADEGFCTYDEDSAEEVGIQEGGNVLVVTPASSETGPQMNGTLSVQGPCSGRYDVTFEPVPSGFAQVERL